MRAMSGLGELVRAPPVSLRCAEVTVHLAHSFCWAADKSVLGAWGILANKAEALGSLPLSRAAQTGTDRCQRPCGGRWEVPQNKAGESPT